MMSIIKFLVLIIIGFGLSCFMCAALSFVAMIPSAIFRVLRMRPVAFLVISIIGFASMMQYSAINIIWILVSLIAFIIIIFKHSATLNESKKPGKKLKDDFNRANSQEWAFVYSSAIFMPVLLNLHHILGVEQMNIFEFYWTFDYGIAKYAIVRYAIILMPIIVTYMAANSIFTYGKDAIRDLNEERKQKEIEEQAEKERIKNINPDSLDDEFLFEGSSELAAISIEDSKNNEEETADAENILNDIMNNLN